MPSEQHTFRELYRAHYPALLGYCLRRVHRDHAQDVISEVFTVAWRRRETLPDPEHVLPWLFAVAAKTIANHRRSLRRRTNLLDKVRRSGTRHVPSPELQLVQRSEDAVVLEAVKGLRASDREVMLLSAWEGLSASQIATRFNISVAAAEKRLTRAKRRFADELARRERRIHLTPRVAKEGGRQ